MKTKRNYQSYPRAFKEEAIALITTQGYSVQQAAEAVGVRTNALYRWKQQIEDEQAGKRLDTDDLSELKRLRREVRVLRMEKEILKKASAFFASEMK